MRLRTSPLVVFVCSFHVVLPSAFILLSELLPLAGPYILTEHFDNTHRSTNDLCGEGSYRPAAHWRISASWCASRLPPCGRTDGRRAGRRLGWSTVPPGPCHILHPLLPDRRTDSHALRTRRHALSLSCTVTALTDSNFITRQLFKDPHWHSFLRFLLYACNLDFYFHVFQVVAVCQTTLINEYVCMYLLTENIQLTQRKRATLRILQNYSILHTNSSNNLPF